MGNNIILCLRLGNDNKNNFLKIVFVSTSTTSITEVLREPDISVNNNESISAVLSCSIFHSGTCIRLGRVP